MNSVPDKGAGLIVASGNGRKTTNPEVAATGKKDKRLKTSKKDSTSRAKKNESSDSEADAASGSDRRSKRILKQNTSKAYGGENEL